MRTLLLGIIVVNCSSLRSLRYSNSVGAGIGLLRRMSDFKAAEGPSSSSSLGHAAPEAAPEATVVDEGRAKELKENLKAVQGRVDGAVVVAGREADAMKLIAVSKTKPSTDIQALYDAGQRDFGENYFQELLSKVGELPKDIRWHFIGHLQSAKAGPIVKGCPNLACVETVDSAKLAGKLNTASASYRGEDNPLNVCLQVDTSGEASKSGVSPAEAPELAAFVKDKCPNLHVLGLMTIGAPGDFSCFDRLVECRANVAAVLDVEPSSLELSMGMSGDFEAAIERGSTRVRVGSTIFGARDYTGSKV